jgi:pre-mRNA branch site protein p14
MSQFKLPADASRILFIRHLPDAITHDELYELFGRFGAVEQIRLGRISNPDTRGKAYIVYEDVFDAKAAVDELSGHNVMGRYISVVFHRPPKAKVSVKEQLEAQRETVASLRAEVKKH